MVAAVADVATEEVSLLILLLLKLFPLSFLESLQIPEDVIPSTPTYIILTKD